MGKAGAKRFQGSGLTDLLAVGRRVRRGYGRQVQSRQCALMAVDDPYEKGAKVTVQRQTRGDPLGRLHAHRQIDDAQYYAGRSYQGDREYADRGARAIDPSRVAVDGGQLPEALTDRQVKARKRLVKIRRDLGHRLMSVLDDVLINGKTREQIAQSNVQSILKLHGNLFRVALSELATIYGYSNGEKCEEVIE